MERKTQDKIFGEMQAELNSDVLLIYACTFSGDLVKIDIAVFDEENFYRFKFRPFNYSEALEEYLKNICRDAENDALSKNKLRHYILIALTDFLVLYSQRFY